MKLPWIWKDLEFICEWRPKTTYAYAFSRARFITSFITTLRYLKEKDGRYRDITEHFDDYFTISSSHRECLSLHASRYGMSKLTKLGDSLLKLSTKAASGGHADTRSYRAMWVKILLQSIPFYRDLTELALFKWPNDFTVSSGDKLTVISPPISILYDELQRRFMLREIRDGKSFFKPAKITEMDVLAPLFYWNQDLGYLNPGLSNEYKIDVQKLRDDLSLIPIGHKSLLKVLRIDHEAIENE